MRLKVYDWIKEQGRPVKLAEVIRALKIDDNQAQKAIQLLKACGSVTKHNKNGWFVATEIVPKPAGRGGLTPQERICDCCGEGKFAKDFSWTRGGRVRTCKACFAARRAHNAAKPEVQRETKLAFYKPPKGNAAGVMLQELTCCWGVPREDERMAA